MTVNTRLMILSLAAACFMTILIKPAPAGAANWLALQGTEPAAAAPRVKIWGFVQPEFQQTDDTKLQAGGWAGQSAVFNQIRPNLNTHSSFNVMRARLGARGTGFPLDSRVNYFFLVEAGNNGITKSGGGSVRATDASVTLSHIPGARVRVGQFKVPGAEEGLQAIHVFDYINFTNVTNQMVLERFFDGDGSDTTSANNPNGSVNAFRDIGVQIFDIFRFDSWEVSYAVMFGNGNGINRGDNNADKDLYLYFSTSKIFGGKGPRRQDIKVFAWRQNGKRTLTGAGAGDYDRTRWGVGFTFRKDKYRAAGEYIKANGMIFNGTDGGAVPGASNNKGTAVASWNILPEDEADGYYIHLGYMALPALELDLRYDILSRATRVASKERKFETWTLGAQYFFNKKSRMLINYEIRSAEAPNLPSSHAANKILGGMDNRLAAQILIVF